MVKRFVLDTSILLYDPHCITDGFDDNIVIICGTVLQELDRKKDEQGEAKYKARECGRILDELRKQGDLVKGVKLPSGGIVRVEPDGVNQDYLPDGYSISVPDNRIISSCIHLNKKGPKNVILVTNDILMRVNAMACGVEVAEYLNSVVEESGYSGHEDIDVAGNIIDTLYQNGRIKLPKQTQSLYENTFVTLHNGRQSALSVYRDGELLRVNEQTLFGNVHPKNSMQTYAMWALTAPAEEIPLVVLLGPAGTAKTFLSLAAGLSQTYTHQNRKESEYRKILISRPTAESYQDIGFLPGDLSEKLSPLLASYYDNMEILLNGSGKGEDRSQIRMQMEDMLADGIVEVCGLNFIRGRSLTDCYLICDEAQNASQTLIRDVITRAGRGTKIVIAGDPNQIDVPTLNKRNNGLVFAAETMKSSPLAAVVKFDTGSSVRSPLAKDAIERMKIG